LDYWTSFSFCQGTKTAANVQEKRLEGFNPGEALVDLCRKKAAPFPLLAFFSCRHPGKSSFRLLPQAAEPTGA